METEPINMAIRSINMEKQIKVRLRQQVDFSKITGFIVGKSSTFLVDVEIAMMFILLLVIAKQICPNLPQPKYRLALRGPRRFWLLCALWRLPPFRVATPLLGKGRAAGVSTSPSWSTALLAALRAVVAAPVSGGDAPLGKGGPPAFLRALRGPRRFWLLCGLWRLPPLRVATPFWGRAGRRRFYEPFVVHGVFGCFLGCVLIHVEQKNEKSTTGRCKAKDSHESGTVSCGMFSHVLENYIYS